MDDFIEILIANGYEVQHAQTNSDGSLNVTVAPKAPPVAPPATTTEEAQISK